MSRGGIFEICGDDMKLKDICEINPRTLNIGDDTEVSFIPMPSVSEDGKIDTSDIRTYADVKKGYTTFKENDVLFAKITPCMENGKGAVACGLKNGYGCGSSEFHVLRATELVIPEWLYYLTARESFRKEAEKHMTGSAGQRRVPRQYLENYTVNIPLLSQQEQQVQILSRLKLTIDHRKEQLKAFDDLIKARFVEMFGDVATENYKYETRKLGDVAEVGSSHRVFTTEFVDAGIPFYRGTEIGELANGQKPSDPYYISEEHYNRLANDDTKPKVGDLLMPSICNKGQVWMVDTDEPFYYKDGRVLCISANRDIFDTRYLQYFMKVKTEVEYPKMGSGSTFAEFKIFLLKDFDVLTPPKKAQEEFSNFVEQVDKSKVVAEKNWNIHNICLVA